MGSKLNNDTIVAFSHSKHRDQFGMVGVELDEKNHIAYPRLAKQWSRDNLNQIPLDVAKIYKKLQWTDTFADQLIGQSLIRNIEHEVKFIIHTITTQKNLKDPEDIEKIKVMDMTEMPQFLLTLKQAHKLQFPPNPTDTMKKLMSQVEMFTEHTTESGTMSYYSPGDELDNLTRALMICCFAGRHHLQHGVMPMIIQRGVTPEKSKHPSYEEELLGELFADPVTGSKIRNNMDIYNIFRSKRYF